MDKRMLQTFSTWAKDNLENQIEVSLRSLGINGDKDIKNAKTVGDFTVIEGDATSYPASLYGQRNSIIGLVKTRGYKNVIEEFAYTWFNRFVALRFMEAHGFLTHGFRVFPVKDGDIEPEIMKNLSLVRDELKLDMNVCSEYKSQGKIEELYRYVLLHQCNVLSGILPMLFSTDMGHLELLLPKTLLKGETVITRLVEIPEENFLEDVEIIGWMYQFYISSKKDAVYASKKTITKDTLPAVTQLFTPDWIVRYMAQNSVGRLWLESYPDSSLRSEMKYYVEDAEQTPEVQKKLDEIRYRNVNPEAIRVVEPCCGSGHILVYVFDLLYKMYDERGYQKRDIPTLILKNNLTGLDVDKRAAQLASFALVMKARSVNNRFFNPDYYVTPHVYELKDSQYLQEIGYRKIVWDLGLLSSEECKVIDTLVDIFENGKTIGSLLKVPPIDYVVLDEALDKIDQKAVSTLFNNDFLSTGMKQLHELSMLAKVLSSKYDVMITNPPYRPISSMEASVSNYALKQYPNSKADMFAMFMETGLVKPYGFMAMINMHNWMFLPTYKQLRLSFLASYTIINMAQLGPRAFEAIGGEVVQTTAFVVKKTYISDYKNVFYRLVDPTTQSSKEGLFLSGRTRYEVFENSFSKLPGSILAYWTSDKVKDLFANCKPLSEFADPRQGLATGNDNEFLRFWPEVDYTRFTKDASDIDAFWSAHALYAPFNKGGAARKWYGNNWHVIRFDRNCYSVMSNQANHLPSRQFYFKPGITWSALTSGIFTGRYCSQGYVFAGKGPMCFPYNDDNLFYLCGLLNSNSVGYLYRVLSQTMDFNQGTMRDLPFIIKNKQKVDDIVKTTIELSKSEWDSYETSWDFNEHPLVSFSRGLWDATAIGASMHHYYGEHPKVNGPLELCYMLWQGECSQRFEELKANEEELNRIFIDVYGLHGELTPEVDNQDVTIRLADKERDIRSLISYLIGIIMGRYSLDVEGIAYAGGEWDASKYRTYQPDDDGIVPIYTKIGMEDGLTTKLVELIKLIYGDDTYRQNIDFIAEALGKNRNESSEETLNRYLNDGFFADHLKIYQKRPIYWLFSSGKKAGFKCLIYMHRYNEDTLARINAKYYLPESTRKKNELDELNTKLATAEGRERIQLEKERQALAAAYNEALEYGQVLDHMANQYISIDLDDGVKVNYAKFQGIELVTDSGAKVKKDLLSPLK